MSPRIRSYRNADAVEIGKLIADTFLQFNLTYASPCEQQKLLGPFRHAESSDPDHRAAIAAAIRAPLVLVAEDESQKIIVGVLRGSAGRIHSLFVRGTHHRRGVGRRLVEVFERDAGHAAHGKITLQSTLLAVPFYQRLGYKRSTGIRAGPCFDGTGFRHQPMRKILGSVA